MQSHHCVAVPACRESRHHSSRSHHPSLPVLAMQSRTSLRIRLWQVMLALWMALSQVRWSSKRHRPRLTGMLMAKMRDRCTPGPLARSTLLRHVRSSLSFLHSRYTHLTTSRRRCRVRALYGHKLHRPRPHTRELHTRRRVSILRLSPRTTVPYTTLSSRLHTLRRHIPSLRRGCLFRHRTE